MNESKSLFASKGVMGGVVAALAGVVGVFGYTITPEDQAALITLIPSIVAIVGGIVAMYGRIKATKKIGNAQ